MSFFSLKNNPAVSLIFDVRDYAISIAAIKLKEDGKPEMILCKRFEIKNTDTTDYAKYTDSMIKTLDNGIIAIRKSLARMGNLDKIKDYHFFIGSPWSVSESKKIKIVKDRPFEVTKEIIERIVNDEELATEQGLSKKNNANWKLLEEKIIQFKLNGYKVEKIFDKKITELEAEVFVSFIPRIIHNYLSKLNLTGAINVTLNSSTLASYVFFRDLYADRNNFIYIDVSKFVTELYLVKDDVISGIASFPFGEKHMIRAMKMQENLDENKILSYINMYCHGSCDTEVEKIVKRAAKASVKVWLEQLNRAISKLSSDIDIPKDIFIIENSNAIKTLFKEIRNEGLKISLVKTKIDFINESRIDDFVANGKSVKEEPYVKMDTVFLNKNISKK